jgi:protein TonB
MDTQAIQTPPAPAGPPDTFGGDVDPSSRSRAPLNYPPAALRAGITGTTVAAITFDAQGNVIEATVEKSSRNRDLDRECLKTVKKWKVNPGKKNGQAVGGRALIPCEFKM